VVGDAFGSGVANVGTNALRYTLTGGGVSIPTGVGVASGAALVGNVGSEEFRNFVAHGDTVNLAARLQTGAQAGQVVISSSTYALVRDLARVRPLGHFSVKGKSAEVQAFVLDAVLP